jgi:hypothetical protein
MKARRACEASGERAYEDITCEWDTKRKGEPSDIKKGLTSYLLSLWVGATGREYNRKKEIGI